MAPVDKQAQTKAQQKEILTRAQQTKKIKQRKEATNNEEQSTGSEDRNQRSPANPG